ELSAADAASVRAEVDRIVHHPLFGHSRRYPAMLRYVVDRTLEGKNRELKERTVGIEGLGRPVSYDPSQDPLVRTTAAEVRRRLALYYQEAGESQVRIQLPVGSYVPQFLFPETPESARAEDPNPAPSEEFEPGALGLGQAKRRHSNRLYLTAALAIPIIAVSGLYMLKAPPPPAIDRLWAPVVSGSGTVGVCVG